MRYIWLCVMLNLRIIFCRLSLTAGVFDSDMTVLSFADAPADFDLADAAFAASFFAALSFLMSGM